MNGNNIWWDASGKDKILNQIFPIHAYKRGKQHSLIYTFLTNKFKATYDKLFYIIQEKAQNLQLQFKSETGLMIWVCHQTSNTIDLHIVDAIYHFCLIKIQDISLHIQYKWSMEQVNSYVEQQLLPLLPFVLFILNGKE